MDTKYSSLVYKTKKKRNIYFSHVESGVWGVGETILVEG